MLIITQTDVLWKPSFAENKKMTEIKDFIPYWVSEATRLLLKNMNVKCFRKPQGVNNETPSF